MLCRSFKCINSSRIHFFSNSRHT